MDRCGIDTWYDGNSGEDETIFGLQLLPLETHAQTDDVLTKNVFSYPFEGKWMVIWGGMNSLVNYHYAQANPRYACDLVIAEDDRSFSGDGEKNDDYYAFGQNVIAPANGKVVSVVNDIADNLPGEMHEQEPAGNHVFIDHGHDEYSPIAHFQEKSIEVEEGDEVKQGDLLGLVGNSGNSSEPHIHFQVSDAPSLDEGESIRIKLKNDENPVQGDMVTGD